MLMIDAIPDHLRMPPSESAQAQLVFLNAWARARGGRMLVVDDSPTNRLVLSGILQNAGFTITQAMGGLEAVEAVRDLPDAPELVLMDVAMPEVDGFMATRGIRSLPGARGLVPIIAVTAHVNDETRLNCEEAGMNDFLVKPVRKATLLAALRRWLPP